MADATRYPEVEMPRTDCRKCHWASPWHSSLSQCRDHGGLGQPFVRPTVVGMLKVGAGKVAQETVRDSVY